MKRPFNIEGILSLTRTIASPVGSNLAPLQGASHKLMLFPALKRRANFSCPSGARFFSSSGTLIVENTINTKPASSISDFSSMRQQR